MKQKNYRDFTVGELLDAGLTVEVKTHDLKKASATITSSKFEGAKRSMPELRQGTKVIRAWKGKFEFTAFVREESQ